MRWLRLILIVLIVRPLTRLIAGADVIGEERLPLTGPAIVAANHSSHIDTLLLLTLFSPRAVGKVRPVAAADYFLADPVISWVSRRLIGIVPVERGRAGADVDPLAAARAALANGDILIVFPEGTRGAASDMAPLKSGVARLAEAFPAAPVIPVWIEGAGRVLPKGAHVPVPMTCCVLVGEPMCWAGDRAEFMARLKDALEGLQATAPPLRWAQTVENRPSPQDKIHP